MTTKKEKELLRRSLKGNWRSNDWKYIPAGESAVAFHARQQERRRLIPVVSFTKVQD